MLIRRQRRSLYTLYLNETIRLKKSKQQNDMTQRDIMIDIITLFSRRMDDVGNKISWRERG